MSKLISWLDVQPKKGSALSRVLYEISTILIERGEKRRRSRVGRGTVETIEITIYKYNNGNLSTTM